ncbi:MAG: response regulator [Verrucomicrobia bacterium]|nr:response regulator [Verrucomicrobiota bacterium]
MKTLLVIAPQPSLAQAVRSVLDAAEFRVLHHAEVWAAEPLFSQGTVDAVILDAELTDVRPIRALEHLRSALPSCPVILYASASQWEWEEEAYLLGVDYILTKPVRARLLSSLLERSWQKAGNVAGAPPSIPPPAVSTPDPSRKPDSALGALRDFSGILTHSLQTDALLREFLRLLREILGVNRAAIFLRRAGDLQSPPSLSTAPAGDFKSPALHAACALGIAPQLLNHFTLSFRGGIGAHLQRHARILRRGTAEAAGDPDIAREFELLGAQVAIPIFDRETLLGIAVFDGRLTGELFASEELSLVFHLLEELGLAIRNARLHDALAGQHGMMTDTLDQLGGAVVVVARDLGILQANHTARGLFRHGGTRPGDTFAFTDLPQSLGSKVFAALQTGTAPPPSRCKLPGTGDTTFRVVLKPFQSRSANAPEAVLLLLEDVTHADRAQQMEVEAANLRLVRKMAEQLAHEIGNSLVPISTSQQLLSEGKDNPAVRKEVTSIMGDSVRRITRLTRQMQFLSRDGLRQVESIPLAQLIEEAFAEAHAENPRASARLQYQSGGLQLSLIAERAGLKHALAEVLLNALQATPGDQPVEVESSTEIQPDGARWVRIDVRDAGGGFDADSAAHATEPFYSQRTVGLGLGLTVTRKIIELHRGRLDLHRSKPGTVSLALPAGGTDPGQIAE